MNKEKDTVADTVETAQDGTSKIIEEINKEQNYSGFQPRELINIEKALTIAEKNHEKTLKDIQDELKKSDEFSFTAMRNFATIRETENKPLNIIECLSNMEVNIGENRNEIFAKHIHSQQGEISSGKNSLKETSTYADKTQSDIDPKGNIKASGWVDVQTNCPLGETKEDFGNSEKEMK